MVGQLLAAIVTGFSPWYCTLTSYSQVVEPNDGRVNNAGFTVLYKPGQPNEIVAE